MPFVPCGLVVIRNTQFSRKKNAALINNFFNCPFLSQLTWSFGISRKTRIYSKVSVRYVSVLYLSDLVNHNLRTGPDRTSKKPVFSFVGKKNRRWLVHSMWLWMGRRNCLNVNTCHTSPLPSVSVTITISISTITISISHHYHQYQSPLPSVSAATSHSA